MWGGILAAGLTVGSIGYSLWQAMNKSDKEIQREVDTKTREALRIATSAKRGTREIRKDMARTSKLDEGAALADDLLSTLGDFQQDHVTTMDTSDVSALKQQMGVMGGGGAGLPMSGGDPMPPEPVVPSDHYPAEDNSAAGPMGGMSGPMGDPTDPVLDRGRSLIGSPAMAQQLVQRRRLKGQTPLDFDMLGLPT